MTSESAQILAIRARYKKSLVEKAAIIEERTALIKNSSSQELAETLAAYRDELHKLAGSSGMYGYQDICDLCRRAMSNIDASELTDMETRSSELHRLLLEYAKS